MGYRRDFYAIKLSIAITLSVIVSQLPLAVATALTATTMTPASGTVDGGSMVVIKGSGFMRTETEKFQDIAAGVEHAVLLSNNGHVWTLGSNTRGQLGTGSIKLYETIPQDITASFKLDSRDQIVSIAAGDYYSFAISQNHRVFAWGSNNDGELGTGSRNDSPKPTEITGNFELATGDYVTAISAGVNTTFALTNGGDSFVWGYSNDYMDGQTNEVYTAKLKPTRATNWLTGNIKQLAVGNKSAISMNANGQIATWGSNRHGEMGRTKAGERNDTATKHSLYFIQDNFELEDGDQIVDVEAGNGVMAVITKYHRVFIWGNDQGGMLGLDGEIANPSDSETGKDFSSSPIEITDVFALPSDDCIAQISIGNSHVLAVSQYGEAYSWGRAMYGQLGQGDEVDQPGVTSLTSMFKLADEVTLKKVVAGGAGDEAIASYSFALDTDGNVYAWGGSAKGNPGINMLTNVSVPRLVSDRLTTEVSNIASITFGEMIVDNYDVASDETIRLLAPNALVAEKVNVTITDRDGNMVDLPQAFTYTNPSGSLDNTPTDKDNQDDNANKDNKDENNNQDDKDKDGGKSDQDNDDKSDDDGKKASSSANNSKSKVTIAAPNTGIWVN
ncbi:MAG: hypothetical protein Q4C83_00725 [Candidatus Saccharibacteria bacterium]|nr:hypothetical protein [Candidatus Saccharibacteria bacterium]